MLAERSGRLTFLILLADEAEASGVARYLEAACLTDLAERPAFLVPPIRGLDFLADPAHQAEVDRWWASSVPAAGRPVYLLMHQEGLAGWLEGLDGTFYVGLPDEADGAGYATLDSVRCFPARGPLDLTATVMADLSVGSSQPLFQPQEAERLERLRSLQGGVTPAQPPAEANGAGPAPPSGQVPDPFDLIISATAEDGGGPELDGRPAPPPRPAPPALRRSGWRAPGWPQRRQGEGSAQQLAAAAVGRGPTVVLIGSRKGGVGKTSHAAGVAIAAGEALDCLGHRAAIVDANVANPDAWGQLNLPRGAATVREVVAALTANREPPNPVYSTTPALACYPEARETSDYSRTDIDRLADYLRRRFTLVVVDLSNRLPDPLGGPEAAVAAWWLEHGDVLVLPTASSRQDFSGVMDYLDVRGRPPTVVPYLVPPSRRNRRHQVTRQYLEAIGSRVHRIVPMPDEADRVRYAVMEGVPVQQVSARLRAAYRDLLGAVVRLPPRGEGAAASG